MNTRWNIHIQSQSRHENNSEKFKAAANPVDSPILKQDIVELDGDHPMGLDNFKLIKPR